MEKLNLHDEEYLRIKQFWYIMRSLFKTYNSGKTWEIVILVGIGNRILENTEWRNLPRNIPCFPIGNLGNFYHHLRSVSTYLTSIGHVNEYNTIHYFGKPRHTQSMIAYSVPRSKNEPTTTAKNLWNSSEKLHCGNVNNMPYSQGHKMKMPHPVIVSNPQITLGGFWATHDLWGA